MSKQVFYLLVFLLLLEHGLNELKAQALFIKEISGTQTAYNFIDIRKVTFSSGNMNVISPGGNSDTYSLTNIDYLYFKDTTLAGIINQKLKADNVLLYPNPVIDVLNIQFTSSRSNTLQFEILSSLGNVVYRQIFDTQIGENTKQINLTALPNGMYLCQLNNGIKIYTSKFLKIKTKED